MLILYSMQILIPRKMAPQGAKTMKLGYSDSEFSQNLFVLTTAKLWLNITTIAQNIVSNFVL